MKKQSFSLAIRKPCTENWDAMNPAVNGNFCSSCQKTVLDFTTLSDEEIIRIIQHKTGSICGRLNNTQLERHFVFSEQPQNASRFHTLVAGIAALGLAETTALAAQSNNPAPVVQQQPSPQLASALYEPAAASDSSHFTLSGKITESVSELAIPYALVSVKNSSCRTQTDSLGNFSLPIPDSLAADTLLLEINCIGYVSKEVSVTKTSPQLIIRVDPVELFQVMGDIQVVPDNLQMIPVKRKHRRWFR